MPPEKPAINPIQWLSRTALLAAALGLAACAQADTASKSQASAGPIGLFTSLPIFWAETADLRGLLNSDAPPHWGLAALRRHGELRPVDSLVGHPSGQGMAGIAMLIMAQSRPLAPDENVALDAWVRAGGRLLLFADPMLTEESAYPLGDKRRPQDMAMLSPILSHWKLRLLFDEDQAPGERQVDIGGVAIPVNLPGRFVAAPGSRHCTLMGNGLVAQCRIGNGHVLLIADAALLEQQHDPLVSGRGAALDWLVARLAEAR